MRYDDYDDYSSRSSRGSSRRGSSSYSSGRDYDRDYYRDRDYRSDFGRDYDRGYYDRDRYSDRYSTRSSRDWYDDFDRSDWERTAPNWEDHGAARKKQPAGGSTRSSRPAPQRTEWFPQRFLFQPEHLPLWAGQPERKPPAPGGPQEKTVQPEPAPAPRVLQPEKRGAAGAHYPGPGGDCAGGAGDPLHAGRQERL